MLMEDRVEGLAWADPGVRTTICVSGNFMSRGMQYALFTDLLSPPYENNANVCYLMSSEFIYCLMPYLSNSYSNS
jgi:hypothetical protein